MGEGSIGRGKFALDRCKKGEKWFSECEMINTVKFNGVIYLIYLIFLIFKKSNGWIGRIHMAGMMVKLDWAGGWGRAVQRIELE